MSNEKKTNEKETTKVSWTADQQKVIDLRNRNILVSAAAGSGKTAVLVERIIQMVTNPDHPVDIDHLLIVTFTKAAASEMRERIGAAIEKKLQEFPENEHLQKQATLIHSAQITTTHSFCQSVVRNNFNLIDLDPTFRVGEEAELTLMKSDVIAAILEEEYELGNEAFLNFVESYSNGKSDQPIEELILQLHRFSMSYPWPREWLESLTHVFEIDDVESLEQQEFIKMLLEYAKSVALDLQAMVQELVEVAESTDGPYTYLTTIEKDREQIARLAKMSSFEEFYLALKGIEFGRLSSKKADDVDPKKKDYVKNQRKLMKTICDDLQSDYFYQPLDQMLSDIVAAGPLMKELVRLTLRFEEEFQKMKQEKLTVDFNDLEHMALRILVNKEGDVVTPSVVAKELSEYYEEILIDEYQDSNMVQETILNSISKERLGRPNIFMVGDVKQSIYKFRLARPELFMEKYEKYSVEDSLYQRIDLHKNFRSRGIVLDAINYICERIMTKKLGNIEYDEDAALYVGANFPETNENISMETELLLVTLSEGDEQGTEETESEGNESDEEQEYSKKEIEAKAVALRIKEIIGGENPAYVLDKKGFYRQATYKDVVILLRTMSNWADVFVDTLLSEGIPAYADTASGYFETLEIKTILNVLRVIDNPLQDIAYTAVLHSPIGNFENEELALLREFDRDSLMHHVVEAYANRTDELSEIETKIRSKCSAFLELLYSLREMEQYLSIHELILRILEDTHYYDFVSAMPAGNVRRANIDMLVQRAITFETTSYKGLFHFIRYIEQLHKYEIDFGEASVSNENDDTVRIMSIHKSKGLEFPIVFVSGMGKSFNNQDANSRIVIHPDMGLGPEVIDLTERVKAPTLIKKVIQKMTVLENLGEELRVLYVALTRAKEKLIMSGYVKDIGKLVEKYRGVRSQIGTQLKFLQLTRAKSFLDYVIPALMRHDTIYNQLLMYVNQGYVYNETNEDLVPMRLRIIESNELIHAEKQKQMEQAIGKELFFQWDGNRVYNSNIKEQIETIMDMKYPFQREVELHAKVTVTELKRLRQKNEEDESIALYPLDSTSTEEQDTKEDTESTEQGQDIILMQEAPVPRFMREEKIISGAARGTLYHKLLEEMNLFEMENLTQIQTKIDELIQMEKIPCETKEKVNCHQLLKFAKSNLASRMKKAYESGKLYREQQFVMGIKANEINEVYVSDELMLVQGIIDVFFVEEDGIVLMDYKTDVVRSKNEQELIDKYRVQLEYYQKAIEQLMGKSVKEKIIYSFYLGKEIVIL